MRSAFAALFISYFSDTNYHLINMHKFALVLVQYIQLKVVEFIHILGTQTSPVVKRVFLTLPFIPVYVVN